MKKSRRTAEKKPAPAARRSPNIRLWALAGAGALVLALAVYAPALRGPFVFDDLYLPFTDAALAAAGLGRWLMGVRPLLMLSFWANYQISGLESYSYHLLNVLLHVINAVLVLLAVRRIAFRAGVSGRPLETLAAFCGGVFLLHPLQTEAVAYVASRSDVLSTTFFLGALVVFLYRRAEGISWPASAGVLVLFGAAVTTKENTAVLPVLLLLTDYFWNPGFSFQGIRRNWKLYAATVAAGALAAKWVLRIMAGSDTAGFSLPEFTWREYFYTQGRAIWVYMRMFVLPYGQTIDHDFPISRTALAGGALLGLVALAGAAAAAIWFRRRYPLASYGFLAFLILLAPTSSFLPILDPFAERRMYLPMFGLLLVAAEFLRRWRTKPSTLVATLASVLAVFAAISYSRNHVWGSSLALWTDAVEKAPKKMRPHFQLAFVYYEQGKCEAALTEYEKAAKLDKPDYRLLVDWALAYDCLGRSAEAIPKLLEAAKLQRLAHVYSVLGMSYLKLGRRAEAEQALNTAEKLDPRYVATYLYRAALYATANEFPAALEQYRRVLQIDPENADARTGVAMVEQRLRGSR